MPRKVPLTCHTVEDLRALQARLSDELDAQGAVNTPRYWWIEGMTGAELPPFHRDGPVKPGKTPDLETIRSVEAKLWRSYYSSRKRGSQFSVLRPR